MGSLQALRGSLFFVSLPIFFINFVLPVKSKELGASAFEIGGLFSLFTFSLVLLRPIVGLWIDRVGRKVFFLMALLLYTLAYLGYAFSVDLTAMYLSRFCQGIGASLLLITVDTITTDLITAEQRGQALGKNIEIQTRASMLGTILGFTLVGVMPLVAWQYSFYLFAAAGTAGLLLALLKLKQTGFSHSQTYGFDLSLSDSLKRFLVILAMLGFAGAVVQPIFLVYLQDEFTTDIRLLAGAFLPMGLLYAVLPSRTGKLSDRYGPATLLIAGAMVTGCVYLVIPFIQGYWLLIGVYTISATGWVLIEPARKAFVANFGHPATVAKNFGMSEFAYGCGATIGPLAGGYLYDVFSLTVPLVITSVLLAVIAMLIRWYLPRS